MGSDVKLTFGVDGVGAGGESYEQIKKDLETVVTNIGTVKFKLAVDDKALSAIKDQISDLVKLSENVKGINSDTVGDENKIKIIKQNTDAYYTAIKQVTDELTKVELAQKKYQSTVGDDEGYKKAYEKLAEYKNSLIELGNNLDEGLQSQSGFASEMKRIRAEYSSTMEVLKTGGYSGDISLPIVKGTTEYYNSLRSITSEISRVEDAQRKWASAQSSSDEKIRNEYDNLGRYVEELGKFKQGIEAGTMSTGDLSKNLASVKLGFANTSAVMKEYAASMKGASPATLIAGTESYNRALTKTDDLMSKLADAQVKYSKYQSSANSNVKSSYDVLGRYSDEVASLRSKLEAGLLTQSEFTNEIDRISKVTDPAINSLSAYSDSAVTLAQQVNNVTTRIGGMFTGYMLLRRGMSTIRDMINEAIELDDAMTQMRIVTKATGEQMVEFGDNISDAAQRVAAPITDLVDATTTFARLGYDINSASQLAEFTGMLQQVGDISADSAQDAITSIMKAFPKDADVKNIESIMDRLVATGNGFPVSVSQLAQGMTNASSALAAAGNSFDQSVALLTAANVTIQDASKSSTGLRTIAARIRNTKTELDALGETENFAKYDKLVQALTRYNVKLTDVTGQYRSTFEILQDIAKIWDQLDTMEQAALATQLAGTRQQAVFYSIIEQFKDAEGAMEAMQNSAGTLEESYAYYLDSMSAHVNTFKNAWTEMSATIAQKGIVTSVVDFGTAIVNAANKLAKVHMLLPAIAASILAIKTTMNLIKKESAFAALSKTISGMSADVLKQSSAQQVLLASTVTLTKAQKENLQVQIMERVAAGEMSTADAQLIITKLGLATATKAETAATNGLAASFTALFATNPLGMIMTGITLVTTIVGLVKNFKSEVDDTPKSFSTIKSEIENLSTDIDSTASAYRELKKISDELIPRYAELANGVDAYGRNVSLTDEEYEEFLDTQNKLAEMFPEISAGMDENGNAMLNLDHRAEDLTNRLNGLVEKQKELANLRIAGTMQDALDDIRAQEKNLTYGYTEEDLQGGIVKDLTLGKIGANEATSVLNALKEIQKETPGAIVNGTSVEAQIAIYQGILDRIKAENDEMWKDFSKTTVAWVHSLEDYSGFSEPVRYLVDALVSTVDGQNAFNKMDADQIQSYLYDNIISPIESLTPAAQQRIAEMLSIQDAFTSGTLGATEYVSALANVRAALADEGVEDNLTDKVLGVLDKDGIRDKIDVIRNGIKGTSEEVEAFINSCNDKDIELIINILEGSNGVTLDDVKDKLEDVKSIIEEISVNDALDLSGVFGDIDNVANDISSITNEMQKLQKGTSLTAKEMLALAKKYPQLLKQANLFTDGSIAGQKKLLDTVMECSKKEFNTVLDTKIKELEMVKSNLEAQKKIEQEKIKYMTAIHEQLIKGEISDRGAYLKAVEELSKLEMKQYAKYEGGKITVASKTLNVIEQDTVDFVNTVKESAYIPNAENLANAYKAGAGDVIATTGKMFEQIIQMAANNETSIADAVWFSKVTSGQTVDGSVWSPEEAWNYLYGNRLTYNLRNAISGRGGYSIEGALQQLDGAIADANIFLDNIDTAILEATNSINNLEALKNMDFSLEVTDSNSSNSSSGGEDKEQQESDRQQEELRRKIRDVLNQLLRDLKSFYDAQKQMLKDQLEDEKYLKEQAEKRKTVNDLENLIAQLGLDDSAWAKKRRIALEKELQDAKDKLDEFEQNRAVSEAEKMYDEEYAKQAAIINELLADNNVTVEEINDKLQGIYSTLKGGSAPALGAPYASGTRSATAGLHMIDERGSETIFQSSNGNRYRMFSGGEKVLNAGASDFLYRFASSYGKSLMGGAGTVLSGIARSGGSAITMGNIIINGDASERTVSEIRRAQREQVRELLTAFGRMK